MTNQPANKPVFFGSSTGLELTPDAVLELDGDGIVVAANDYAARMFLSTREELRNQRAERLFRDLEPLPRGIVGQVQLLDAVGMHRRVARGRVEAPGVDFGHVHVVQANTRDALWASEQCLRAGCLSAVLCWPLQADDRALRRLQVAADTGHAMGFAFRDARAERNPSPAALRIAIDSATPDGRPAQLRVLKCRGALPPHGGVKR